MSKRIKTVSTLMALMSMSGVGMVYAGTSPAGNATLSAQQDAECRGVVKDASGEAVIGASVVVKGSTLGTVTDLDGNFVIKARRVLCSTSLTSASMLRMWSTMANRSTLL